MFVKLMKSVLVLAVSVISVGTLAVCAYAQAPKLTLKMTAEKEVTVVSNGKETVEMKPAVTMKTGEVILYTISYKNVGESDAVNAVIMDPIPNDMVYVPGSAKGAGADIAFSIDGGRTFQTVPKQVVAGEEKDADTDTYTNIRWTVKKVAPEESGSVRFKAKVK